MYTYLHICVYTHTYIYIHTHVCRSLSPHLFESIFQVLMYCIYTYDIPTYTHTDRRAIVVPKSIEKIFQVLMYYIYTYDIPTYTHTDGRAIVVPTSIWEYFPSAYVLHIYIWYTYICTYRTSCPNLSRRFSKCLCITYIHMIYIHMHIQIVVPKSIENNFPFMDKAIGFDTIVQGAYACIYVCACACMDMHGTHAQKTYTSSCKARWIRSKNYLKRMYVCKQYVCMWTICMYVNSMYVCEQYVCM